MHCHYICCRPYIKKVIDSVKQTHPNLPIILYISGSGGLLERMAAANPDIISIDQSVDIVDGIKRVGTGFAIQVGNRMRHAWNIQGVVLAKVAHPLCPFFLQHASVALL